MVSADTQDIRFCRTSVCHQIPALWPRAACGHVLDSTIIMHCDENLSACFNELSNFKTSLGCIKQFFGSYSVQLVRKIVFQIVVFHVQSSSSAASGPSAVVMQLINDLLDPFHTVLYSPNS